jgi:hypothetical protein
MFFAGHVVDETDLRVEPNVALGAPVALPPLPLHLPHLGQRGLVQVLLLNPLPLRRPVARGRRRHRCRRCLRLDAIGTRALLADFRPRNEVRVVVEEVGAARDDPVCVGGMAVVELDVAHEDVVAVEAHLADGAGVRVPVVHRGWQGRVVVTAIRRGFGFDLMLEVRLKGVAEVDSAVIDEVGLGVEDVVADQAPRVLADHDVGRVLLQVVFLEVLQRVVTGRVQTRGRRHFRRGRGTTR